MTTKQMQDILDEFAKKVLLLNHEIKVLKSCEGYQRLRDEIVKLSIELHKERKFIDELNSAMQEQNEIMIQYKNNFERLEQINRNLHDEIRRARKALKFYAGGNHTLDPFAIEDGTIARAYLYKNPSQGSKGKTNGRNKNQKSSERLDTNSTDTIGG